MIKDEEIFISGYDLEKSKVSKSFYREYFRTAHFKGNTTSTTTYTPSPEERELMGIQVATANAYQPNLLWLNDQAKQLIDQSLGMKQISYTDLNNQAQNKIGYNQRLLQGLSASNNKALEGANGALSGYSQQYDNNAATTAGQLGGLAGNMNDYLSQNAAAYGQYGRDLNQAITDTNNLLNGQADRNNQYTDAMGNQYDQYGNQLAGANDTANSALDNYTAQAIGAARNTNNTLGAWAARLANETTAANNQLNNLSSNLRADTANANSALDSYIRDNTMATNSTADRANDLVNQLGGITRGANDELRGFQGQNTSAGTIANNNLDAYRQDLLQNAKDTNAAFNPYMDTIRIKIFLRLPTVIIMQSQELMQHLMTFTVGTIQP